MGACFTVGGGGGGGGEEGGEGGGKERGAMNGCSIKVTSVVL